MPDQEYEVIAYNELPFHVFLVNLLYRTTHIHKEFEISCVLEGSVETTIKRDIFTLEKGDTFVVNPYENHELKAANPALILSLQVSYDFFEPYFPQIDSIGFNGHHIRNNKVISDLKQIAITRLGREMFSEIKCTALINELFYYLFDMIGYDCFSEREQRLFKSKGQRMRRLIKYIDEHYNEKLLLKNIAEAESLNLHYLSHFFKVSFGMSFQDYLSRVRCEHARQLLITTDLKLLDICLACGFSDPKYFLQDFKELYGCTPKKYRQDFMYSAASQKNRSLMTVQKFLSAEDALNILL